MPRQKGFKQSEETKEKIRESVKKNLPSSVFKKGHMSLSVFKKGQIPWNKNKPHLKVRGKKHGRWSSVERVCQYKECGKSFFRKKSAILRSGGKFCSTNCASKYRFANKENHPMWGKTNNSGHEHYNWQGGLSFEPYGLEFNKKLKEQIRQRDNFRCQECFRHQDELRTKNNKLYKLSIHHIDYDKRNNNSNNLISLCMPCHLQTNFNRNDWENYYREKTINP